MFIFVRFSRRFSNYLFYKAKRFETLPNSFLNINMKLSRAKYSRDLESNGVFYFFKINILVIAL